MYSDGVFTDIGVLLPSKLRKYSDGTLEGTRRCLAGCCGKPAGRHSQWRQGSVPRQVRSPGPFPAEHSAALAQPAPPGPQCSGGWLSQPCRRVCAPGCPEQSLVSTEHGSGLISLCGCACAHDQPFLGQRFVFEMEVRGFSHPFGRDPHFMIYLWKSYTFQCVGEEPLGCSEEGGKSPKHWGALPVAPDSCSVRAHTLRLCRWWSLGLGLLPSASL